MEESYREDFLAAFEPHVGMTSYLFGSRLSLADFAWFGQLSEIPTDPTPMRIMREPAPFTDHWVRRLDDASGVDGDWYPREQALGGMAEALLKIAGDLDSPFLVANAEAFAKGLDRLAMMSGACLMGWRRSNIRSNACSNCVRNSRRWMLSIAPHYARYWSAPAARSILLCREFQLDVRSYTGGCRLVAGLTSSCSLNSRRNRRAASSAFWTFLSLALSSKNKMTSQFGHCRE